MSIQRIQCPNCGRSTIKGKFCIYCGYTLEETPKAEVSAESPPQEAEAPIIQPPPVEAVKPEDKPESTPPPIQEIGIAEEALEDRRLIEQLASVYNYWFKLLELFLEKEATPEVFQELYNDYQERISTFDKKRIEEIGKIESKIEELNNKLMELKLRNETGELPDKQYIPKKLEIDRTLGKLKPRLTILQNPLNIRLSELPSFKERIESLIQRFTEVSAEELGIDQEFLSRIREDLNKVLKDLDKISEQHKKIRKELDKLELRFKIGGITREEYLAQKQRIEKQLDLQFPQNP